MKSIKNVFGFTEPKKVRKIRTAQLRKMIAEELNVLREQEEAAEEEKSDSGQFTGEYKGDAIDKSTNVKDVNPVEIANQLLSGDDDAPIVQSSKGNWFEYDGAAAKAWIEKVTPEVFVSRLKALANKVPATGLPKSVMPFLPGPEDAQGEVSDVEDALTPGGDYNVDMQPPFKEAAWKKGARYLLEQEEQEEPKEEEESTGAKGGTPPAPNTFVGLDDPAAKEFMTAGLEDGEEGDDSVKIQAGGSVVASDAIPTQSNILIYKSMGFAVDGMAGGDLDAWAGTGGEILDGHHRWAATMLNDPSAPMGTAGQVDLNALGDPKKTLKFLTAIGNALGNKTKTESRRRTNDDDLILERWKRLAGIL